MESLQKATGAAGTLTLNGDTYLLTRVSAKDIAAYETFVREKVRNGPSPIERIKSHLGHCDNKQKRELLRMAYEDAVSFSMDSPRAKEVLGSLEVGAFIIWLSIRKEHPNVKYEKIVADAGELSMDEVQEAVEKVNALGGKKKDAKEEAAEALTG